MGGGPVRLSVAPHAAPGVPLRVEASFRSGGDSAVLPKTLMVELEDPSGDKQPLALTAEGKIFANSFVPEIAGTWLARVAAGEDGAAAVVQPFEVKPPERELRDRTADLSFGRQVAAETGGDAVTPEGAVSAAAKLQMKRVEHVTEHRESLWDKWPYFVLLMTLLFAEWTWRKALRQP